MQWRKRDSLVLIAADSHSHCQTGCQNASPKGYMVLCSWPQARPPMLPTHIFLIDVSYTAMSTGVTASACASIASVLDCLQGAPWLLLYSGRLHITFPYS